MAFVEINKRGVKRYYNDERLLHREDGPAVIYPNGYWYWAKNGMDYRLDAPAIYYRDGPYEWVINGDTSRTIGPAIDYPSGLKEWFDNGRRQWPDIT